MSKSIFETQ